MVHLAHEARWLAKDVVWVLPDASCGALSSLQAWVQRYQVRSGQGRQGARGVGGERGGQARRKGGGRGMESPTRWEWGKQACCMSSCRQAAPPTHLLHHACSANDSKRNQDMGGSSIIIIIITGDSKIIWVYEWQQK